MRGRRKSPKISLTEDEIKVFEKLVSLCNKDDMNWYIRIQHIDSREPYDMIRTFDCTGRTYDIAVQTAVKRIDKSCTEEIFNQLTDEEKITWQNLIFNRLEVIL